MTRAEIVLPSSDLSGSGYASPRVQGGRAGAPGGHGLGDRVGLAVASGGALGGSIGGGGGELRRSGIERFGSSFY